MKRQGASENRLDLPIPDGDVRGYKSQAGFVLGKLDVTITTYLKHPFGRFLSHVDWIQHTSQQQCLQAGRQRKYSFSMFTEFLFFTSKLLVKI